MGLKDLKFPGEVIKTPGGDLLVRGISLPDIVALTRGHGSMLSEIFTKITRGNISLDPSNMGEMGQQLLVSAPALVAHTIALASGDEDWESIKIASQLPFPVQIEALEKIAKLTFDTEGGLKKFVETVIRVAQGTEGAMNDLQRPSLNGSGVSASP